jgi:type II secretory pathway pseudopilin PulG
MQPRRVDDWGGRMSLVLNGTRRPGAAARGLSLVELMVGITVGLFVVAAAATLVAGQLGDNRRLLIETQVQQDLRATVDIISRQLRRAGATTEAVAQGGLADTTGTPGSKLDYTVVSPAVGSNDQVSFGYFLNANANTVSYKLDDEGIKVQLPQNGGLQDLTDRTSLKVTAFTITAKNFDSAVLACSNLCAGGGTACWPTVGMRSYLISVTAQARTDPTVVRSISSEVRLRNDVVRFNDAANPTKVCP